LEKAGICKRLSKVACVTGVHTYEKLAFEGHQALKLLAEEGGKMAVTNILESPSRCGRQGMQIVRAVRSMCPE
jgi:hypothetical protein